MLTMLLTESVNIQRPGKSGRDFYWLCPSDVRLGANGEGVNKVDEIHKKSGIYFGGEVENMS